MLMRNRVALVLAAAASGWIACSSVFWTIKNYNAVPFWDMWTGYVEFAIAAKSGAWNVWLTNHNEHRLIIPRLFFYIDFWCFSGSGVFLQISIFAVQLLLTYFLSECCADLYPNVSKRRLILFMFFSVATFSWLQYENFVWAFQVQFVLLYLFAVLAFLSFSRAIAKDEVQLSGVIRAALFACCSAATMANGLLVFPLLGVWALFTPKSRRIGIAFGLISIVLWLAYFKLGYRREEGAINLAFIHENPTEFPRYFLAYLGVPVVRQSLNLAIIAGIGVLGMSLYLFFFAVVRTRSAPRHAAFWILSFVVVTGVVTALGRAHFGIGQVLSPRYATPVLIAWTCVFSFSVSMCARPFGKYIVGSLGLVFVAFLCWNQVGAKNVPYDQLFLYRKAALSLALNVKDSAAESSVIWDVDRLRRIAQEPISKRLSVFGRSWLTSPVDMLGSYLSTDMMVGDACQGKFERLEWKEGVLVASGWQGEWQGSQIGPVLLADESMLVVGAAVTGEPRQDNGASALTPPVPTNSGWQGYIVRHPEGPVRAYLPLGGDRMFCSIDGIQEVPKRALIESSTIYGPGSWVGNVVKVELTPLSWQPDAYFKGEPGYRGEIYGSYIGGDEYLGELAVSLMTNKDGEVCLPYTTGPDSNGYSVTIDDDLEMPGVSATYLLNASSKKWAALCYRHPGESRNVRFVFRDSGSGFGQWMAISVVQ